MSASARPDRAAPDPAPDSAPDPAAGSVRLPAPGSGPGSAPDRVAVAKVRLRREVYARRRDRLATDPGALATTGTAVRDLLLATPEVAGLRPGATVAAYLELRSEVPVAAVRDALLALGVRVVVPVLQPDGDLDWTPAAAPAGEGGNDDDDGGEGAPSRLGPAAVTEFPVMLLPGVAADRAGNRLGRGGGSYDRALARLAAVPPARRPWTCLVLFADEVVSEVPVDAHDIAVDAVVTPAGVLRGLRRVHDD